MTHPLVARLRSIALVGHGAVGKTTLAEALLYASGAITARGTVEKGNTVCDFDPQEKELGHVTGTQPRGAGVMAITGQVPLAELEDYQSRLKSLTGGKGAYTIMFSHYDQVPPATQQALAAQHQQRPEDD